jgi:hypothetical protein
MNEQKSSFPKKPWNPNSIFGLFFGITTIGVGILLGLNWAPFGKPEWRLKTILLSLLVNVGTILIAVGWIFIFAGMPGVPNQIGLLMPFIALGSNFGFSMALSRLQSGAYKKYQNEGIDAIQDYEYDIRGATRYGIIIVLGAVVFGTFILPAIFQL